MKIINVIIVIALIYLLYEVLHRPIVIYYEPEVTNIQEIKK